ncbi:imidazole glycerol phosphate synthase subunit HisH [Heyndrickxia acidicola]|uniref:Imidazole glycerol phosphate synthase subunit HisH n=1 Tax=Heyndrickxia acidicola TaxID=209389 RepID=A0ABU6MAT1_9BACI|nr:imidazole glycerol phosphate synthase subunit HisH [Heyndrickxia acidicola]MED1201605.1 imidazole glycerol phosphate synthase subunit HisH [Heyndrickxia acidicola]
MIAIVDYGMGNIASVSNALTSLGYENCITDQASVLEEATHIILPGVGSFQAAVEEIDTRGLRPILSRLSKDKPFLGICLGMQLLFEKGNEGGNSSGLSLIPGSVEKIETDLILPHIGWNTLEIMGEQNVFKGFQSKHVYFVHSYRANTPKEYIVASTEYGSDIPAVVQNGKVVGMQFHPEKSGDTGLGLIQTFIQQFK